MAVQDFGYGHLACPSEADRVVGVEWWEDFHEEESEKLLPVLHLSSDWSGSSVTPPYMR